MSNEHVACVAPWHKQDIKPAKKGNSLAPVEKDRDLMLLSWQDNYFHEFEIIIMSI
jgi:hypothetical protein